MFRFLKRLFLLAVMAGLGFGAWLFWFAITPVGLSVSPLELNVEPGRGLRQVSRGLAQSGVGFEPWQFTALARTLGKASAIKAGSYEVEAGLTPLDLLSKLTRGDVSQGDLSLIEGWNLRQVRVALDANPDLRHDSQALSEKDILQKLGATEPFLEGMLFPDTYLFPKRSSDLEVLARAYRAMQRRLQEEWAARDTATPCKTPYEALILASIVEKETGVAADRGKVASVFVNRLRLGMPLQTDPTVIYGLGEKFDGKLHKQDLQQDTAFNTYTRAGLPPGPIALPGRAALHAALHPEQTPYLYFVARGDGSSQFSQDLDSHNRAVARYQRKK
jgi:UPF0755 protein